jgi:hypothetical protein
MSRAIVGRIFWKELRTLGSLWFTLAGVAVVLEVVVAVWLTHSRPWWAPEKVMTAATGTLLAGYVTAILYAIATASATFTSELDGTSGTLLRMIPITRLEAFAGKWSYGLGSTAAMLVAVVFIALIVSSIGGFGSHAASPGSVAPGGVVDAEGASDLVVDVWMGALLPIEFFALCVLSSLLFSNVLMAAALGTFLSTLASCGWWIGPPWINTLFIAAVVSADFWLTGIWLRRGPVAALEPSSSEVEWTPLSRLYRAWQPTVPWQHATQCLFWKEIRQAAPFTGVAVIAVVATSLHTAFSPGVNNPSPSTMLFRWTAHWIAFLSIPLLMGIAAYHVEQQGRLFRLLGERGVTAAGSWVAKHLVWLGLTCLVCLFLFVLDRVAAAWAFDGFGRLPPYRDAPESLFNELTQAMTPSTLQGTRLPSPSVPISTVAGTVALYVLVAYSIGQFFSLLAPKALIALGMGMGGTILVCFGWGTLSPLGVPIVWTVGILPVVLLAFTMSRAERWQIGRSVYDARARLAAWGLIPTVAVASGIILYRIYEIPWIPNGVDIARPRSGRLPMDVRDVSNGALWLRAAEALVMNQPESSHPAARSRKALAPVDQIDWSHVSPAEKKWVAESGQAIALAIDAAAHPLAAIEVGSPSTNPQPAPKKWFKLARLLGSSASECEFDGRLDDAFVRYQASFHLAACLSHRYETWFEGRDIAIDTLRRMQGWAAHPKQTTARVQEALVPIHNLNNQTQPLSVALRAEWKKWLESGDTLANPVPGSPLFVSRQSAHLDSARLADPRFPWEAARDRRLVNALFKTTFLGVEQVERGLRTQGWFSPDGSDIKKFDEQCIDVLGWLSTTPSMNRDQCIVAQDILLALVNSEAKRRMQLLAVALASFHREYSHYPASLHELFPPNWMKWLCDPWTGRGFSYFNGTEGFAFFWSTNMSYIDNANGKIFARIVGGRDRKPSASSNPPFLVSEGFARYQPPDFQAFLNRPLMTKGTESSSKITVVLQR